MALISESVEQEEIQPGRLRNTIHMRKIAVREAGVLLAMIQDWANGDAMTPHIVTRAPLRIRSANDGMRRFFPVPGDDTKYLEIGAPYRQVGGVWTQVALGAPTRTAHHLEWNTLNADFHVWHGGHFCKLEIELKNGFVPENSRIAFPVGIQGLTRSGTEIRNNGVAVAQLRPFVVYDAANPLDVRPITHAFQNISGQPYVLLTLPSLTGMARPVIDPTLTLQPDATAGMDNRLETANVNANNGTSTILLIGNITSGTNTQRTLIKFDLSTLPDAAVISSATLSLWAITDRSSNARTFRVFRQKRAWHETQSTWNLYSTGNSWQTAGGFGADDCEQTDIGSRAFTATETLNAWKDFPLTPISKAALDLGNGWLIKADTENLDCYDFVSSDGSTAGERPKLVLIYTEGGGVPIFGLSDIHSTLFGGGILH